MNYILMLDGKPCICVKDEKPVVIDDTEKATSYLYFVEADNYVKLMKAVFPQDKYYIGEMNEFAGKLYVVQTYGAPK